MGRIWKPFFVLFISSLMLCSCGKNHTKPVYEVVTSVDIVTARDGQLLRRHYETPEKMRPVLLYLRMLKHTPLFETIREPEGEDIFLIAVELTGGKKRYYRQAKHRYFSFDGGAWRSIDPGKAAGLYRILQTFPSDGTTQAPSPAFGYVSNNKRARNRNEHFVGTAEILSIEE